jgi:hypothetical protein
VQYIKYNGGEPLGPITAQVQYEDPEQPCFRGREETRIEVQTRCEDDGIPRERWGEEFIARVITNPYAGMAFIGGVGAIETGPIPPAASVITEAEYATLKVEIDAANGEYRGRRSDALARDNDPFRRALPEDELLGWRTRIWIASFAELRHHVAYRVDECCRAYMRVRQYAPNGMTIQLVDLYHRTNGDIRAASIDGLERAERLIDLLAIAGFGAASILQPVGTSAPVCYEGVPFEVAILKALIVNSPVSVEPELLEHVQVSEGAHLPLRHVREGLNAHLPSASLASFWNALERQAEQRARDEGLRRIVKCKKCGHERHAGWNIKKGFEAMYADARIDADFDAQRALRGRVQHGDAFFSTSSLSEVMPDVVRLLQTAIVAVGKLIGLQPQTGVYSFTGPPVSVLSCTRQGESVSFEATAFEVGAALSILPMRASANKGRRVFTGLDLESKMDPLVFPPAAG